MRGDGVDQTRVVANGRKVADRWCSAAAKDALPHTAYACAFSIALSF